MKTMLIERNRLDRANNKAVKAFRDNNYIPAVVAGDAVAAEPGAKVLWKDFNQRKTLLVNGFHFNAFTGLTAAGGADVANNRDDNETVQFFTKMFAGDNAKAKLFIQHYNQEIIGSDIQKIAQEALNHAACAGDPNWDMPPIFQKTVSPSVYYGDDGQVYFASQVEFGQITYDGENYAQFPGVITSIYKLTDNGFELQKYYASNRFLQSLFDADHSIVYNDAILNSARDEENHNIKEFAKNSKSKAKGEQLKTEYYQHLLNQQLEEENITKTRAIMLAELRQYQMLLTNDVGKLPKTMKRKVKPVVERMTKLDCHDLVDSNYAFSKDLLPMMKSTHKLLNDPFNREHIHDALIAANNLARHDTGRMIAAGVLVLISLLLAAASGVAIASVAGLPLAAIGLELSGSMLALGVSTGCATVGLGGTAGGIGLFSSGINRKRKRAEMEYRKKSGFTYTASEKNINNLTDVLMQELDQKLPANAPAVAAPPAEQPEQQPF